MTERPGPGADHPRPAAAGLRRPQARALRLLVRVLPALHRRPRRDRPAGARLVRHRDQGAGPDRRDGLRRGLPAADPPDRHRAPQGPQQRDLPRRQPGRPARQRRLAVGDRLGRRRARRDRSRAGHDRGLRRLPGAGRGPGHGAGAGLRAAVRAGPPVGGRAPGVVHRAPGRHHRLRGEPAEEVPGHLPGQLRQRPGRHLRRVAAGGPATGSSTGCGSSGWTTRTPSRRTSGTG